jgi:hypothetical protein
MWTVSSTGRNYLKGKALSSDLRTLIIDKIISKDAVIRQVVDLTALTPTSLAPLELVELL